MLNALLVKEQPDFDHLHALFVQCLYWSVGGALLEDGKVKFDNYIKYMCGMTQVEGKRAGPGGLKTQLFRVHLKYKICFRKRF